MTHRFVHIYRSIFAPPTPTTTGRWLLILTGHLGCSNIYRQALEVRALRAHEPFDAAALPLSRQTRLPSLAGAGAGGWCDLHDGNNMVFGANICACENNKKRRKFNAIWRYFWEGGRVTFVGIFWRFLCFCFFWRFFFCKFICFRFIFACFVQKKQYWTQRIYEVRFFAM